MWSLFSLLCSSPFFSVSVSVEKDFQNTSEATTAVEYQQSYPMKKPEGKQTINNDDIARYRSKQITDYFEAPSLKHLLVTEKLVTATLLFRKIHLTQTNHESA